MKDDIINAKRQFRELNRTMGGLQYGEEVYQFMVQASTDPERRAFYDVIMRESNRPIQGDGSIEDWMAMGDAAYESQVNELMERILAELSANAQRRLEGKQLATELSRYVDYRYYLEYDIECHNQITGGTIRLSAVSQDSSGGENQAPFYIAICASLLQIYDKCENSIRLVLLDEAFSRMTSDRIRPMMQMLRKMRLQVVLITTVGKGVGHPALLRCDLFHCEKRYPQRGARLLPGGNLTMDYAIQILTALLDRYERRSGKSSRAVTIEIIKCCPAYRDHLSAEERNIDQAVTCLVDWQMIDAPRSPQGYYTKLTLHLDHLSEIYARLNRTPLADLRQAQRDMLLDAQQREPDSLAGRFAQTLLTQLDQGRALGYRLQDNVKKLRDVLLALEQIGRLDHETYIRNFSEGVFHDSKHFQNIADTVRSILIDLTDQPVEKSEILAYYNLLENPTYLYLKGSWVLELSDSRIPVAALPGGIGLTSDGLQAVRAVHLEHKTVVTVENLTTITTLRLKIRRSCIWEAFPTSPGLLFCVWSMPGNRRPPITTTVTWTPTDF